eukprot:1757912-Rhodomonas_salina.2
MHPLPHPHAPCPMKDLSMGNDSGHFSAGKAAFENAPTAPPPIRINCVLTPDHSRAACTARSDVFTALSSQASIGKIPRSILGHTGYLVLGTGYSRNTNFRPPLVVLVIRPPPRTNNA